MVLLPAPELRFDQVKVADEKGSFGQPLLEAKSIEAWLNIGVAKGNRVVFFTDPDGNYLHLIQREKPLA
jgi:hypothetical protein